MFTIVIIDPMERHPPFHFGSEQTFKKAVNLLKEDCSGQLIKQNPIHFYYRANDCFAAEKMKKFCACNN